MQTRIIYPKPMRMLLIAAMVFASAAQLWAQGQLSQESLIEANRTASQNSGEITFPILPPTPLTDQSSGITPSFQTSSFIIQAVPEPSSFALLTIGLLTGTAQFIRRKKTAAR
jgi:hypothetical protein